MSKLVFDPNSTVNEGRWRLKDPKLFKKLWRDDHKVGVEKAKGISYIKGITNKGKYYTQAIRFNKNIWSEKQAADWWDKNKNQFENTEWRKV